MDLDDFGISSFDLEGVVFSRTGKHCNLEHDGRLQRLTNSNHDKLINRICLREVGRLRDIDHVIQCFRKDLKSLLK